MRSLADIHFSEEDNMLKAESKKVDIDIQELLNEQPEQSETASVLQFPQQHKQDTILNLDSIGRNSQLTEDEEFSPTIDDILKVKKPSQQFETITKFPKQEAEEIVIDELLAGVPQAQGYYLKLAKEIEPNNFQFKTRIDNYETWSDLEWEIVKFVRSMTKKAPSKWGSGKYRIIIWKDGGLRGQKRPPVDIFVDAQEEELMLNQSNGKGEESLEQRLGSVSQIIETVGRLSPKTEQLNPKDVLDIASNAMARGQQMAIDKESKESNSLAVMMTAMVQMMQQSNDKFTQLLMQMNGNNNKQMDPLTMLLIKDMMESKKEKGQNPLSFIKELKEAGLIPERKEQGLTGELNNLLQLKEVAEMFGGGGGDGESGGLLDTLIKGIAPKLPEMIGNVTGAINNVVSLNKAKLAAMNPAVAKVSPPKELPVTQEGEIQSEEDSKQVFLRQFAEKLYGWVVNKQMDKFEELSKAIKFFTGGAPIVEDAIKQNTMGATDLMKFVMDFDKAHYGTDEEIKLLNEYCEEYIRFIKGSGTLYGAKCNKCGAEYNYDSKAEFDADKQDGEVECSEEGCDGTLVPE